MAEIFKRKAVKSLLEWKDNPNRKPLLLRGARQVGKTTLIKDFSSNYDQSVFLNLEKQEHRDIFEKQKNVHNLIEVLSLRYSLSDIKVKSTLLFIDEIQEYPEAIKLLRYFYEELSELHVISAGSLLEHSMGKVSSFPVGRISYLYMFPMNFQEYLRATEKSGYLTALLDIPGQQHLHPTLLEEFNRYLIIGGMPEVIQHYKRNNSLSSLSVIYESIWLTYKDDIEKYARNDTMREVLRYIVDSAPQLVDKRIKYQNFGGSNYRSREVKVAFISLDKAKIIQLIYPSTNTDVPLLPDMKKSPRMQFLDTGIVNYELGIQDELIGVKDLSNSYRGSIVPHMIFQEIISLNTTSYSKPHFWVRDKSQSSAEVDLILQYKGIVIPIEIKSGKTGRLRSLLVFMDKVEHTYAVRFYGGKFNIHTTKTLKGKQFTLMNLPYYLGTQIEKYIEFFLSEY